MTVIISILKIIFLLGFLILIHEAGHMIVAKLCKVHVNEFSIGFGPIIWHKQGRETKYELRLIPLGGFCSMEGEEKSSEKEGSFSKASIPKRIAIVVAGAAVNIVFGIVVYFILMSSSATYVTNEVSSVLDGYAAQEIGLQVNDKIVEFNGKKVSNKYDLNKAMNKAVKIKINADGTTSSNYDGSEIPIKIERNGKIEEYRVKPTEVKSENGSSYYYLGVNLKQSDNTFLNHIKYGGMETGIFVASIGENLKMLFTGKVGVDQMVGPVGISEVVVKTNGFKEFIYIMAVISLSLGVTNLLPIPALDGGKILLLIIEAIRRKPLDEKTEVNLQLIGFSILIALSLYVTYNDILRIV